MLVYYLSISAKHIVRHLIILLDARSEVHQIYYSSSGEEHSGRTYAE